MICEDDAEFSEKFFERLKAVWFEFDMLYLNGTDGVKRKPVKVNNDLVQVSEIYGTFGYILNRRMFDVCIEWLSREEYPADKVYSMFIQFYKVYKLRKPLVFHRNSVSDITGIIQKSYKHLERA